MSSLFSIGEDEFDLDDEDFLLEACEIDANGINNESLSKEAQKVPCGESSANSSFSRKPFTSLGNTQANDIRLASHKTTVDKSCTELAKTSGSGTPNVPSFLPSKRHALEDNGAETSKRRLGCFASSARQHSSPLLSAGWSSSAVRFSSSAEEPPSCRQFAHTTDHSDAAGASADMQNGPGKQWSSKSRPCQNDVAIYSGGRAGRLSHGTGRDQKCFLSPSGYFHKDLPPACSYMSSNASNCSSETLGSQCRLGNTKRSPSFPTRTQNCSPSAPQSHNKDETQHNKNGGESFQTARTQQKVVSRIQPGHKSPATITFEKGNHRTSAEECLGTPTRRSSHPIPQSSGTPRTRKFPGPAGVLPKLTQGQNIDSIRPVSPHPVPRSPAAQNKISPTNPSDDEEFKRDPWTSMNQDFLQNVPVSMRYTITQVYVEASQQRLTRGKVPCMCVLVKAVSLTEADASVSLKDPTGEIHGTLHHRVLEEYQSELGPGAGLVLKQVSVFSPSPRRHYLNITPGNILEIYAPDPQYISSSQSTASQSSEGKHRTLAEQRTGSPEQHAASANQIAVDREPLNDNEKAEARQDGAMDEEGFEDLLQGLEDDDIFDEALLL